ncbi:MAG TPA: CBS domain-containing protein [Aggregatilineales bacterium]|nr:CBS domain-containing protein [Aggregatilineales bacterium]
MLVGNRMTRSVITATPHTTHREAVDLMRKHKIQRLPVMQGKRLVGIVSEEDLLSTAPSPATTLSIYEIYSLLDQLTLDKIMVSPVVTVAPECPLADAAQIMAQRKISCLPVLERDELVGIITETDILKLLVEILGGGEPGIHFTVSVPDERGEIARLADAVARAGGNIVSITSFKSHDGKGQIAIKEQGADDTKLRQYLHEAKAEIVDIQNGLPHQARLVK